LFTVVVSTLFSDVVETETGSTSELLILLILNFKKKYPVRDFVHHFLLRLSSIAL